MIKFLVYDFGLYVHQAEALADGGKNRVKYYTPWPGREPHYKDYCIGKNFGHLEKELYFEKFIDSLNSTIIHLYFFPIFPYVIKTICSFVCFF